MREAEEEEIESLATGVMIGDEEYPLSDKGYQCLAPCRKSKRYRGKWVCQTEPYRDLKYMGKKFNWDYCSPVIRFEEPTEHRVSEKVREKEEEIRKTRRVLEKFEDVGEYRRRTLKPSPTEDEEEALRKALKLEQELIQENIEFI